MATASSGHVLAVASQTGYEWVSQRAVHLLMSPARPSRDRTGSSSG
jgi:hypothetical protein